LAKSLKLSRIVIVGLSGRFVIGIVRIVGVVRLVIGTIRGASRRVIRLGRLIIRWVVGVVR
jgi:hypothetical protein